jgi:hypothetical protein
MQLPVHLQVLVLLLLLLLLLLVILLLPPPRPSVSPSCNRQLFPVHELHRFRSLDSWWRCW